MGWLQNFMKDRHGADHLTYFLLIVYWPLELVGRYIEVRALEYLAFVCLFTALFRALSKNRAARRRENQMLLQLVNPVTQWVTMAYRKYTDRSTHRYFRCPSCKQMLRVPVGKGKIKIRCSKCGATIEAKT